MRRTVEDILNNLPNLPGSYTIHVIHVDFDKEFRKDTPLYEEIRRVFSEISKNPLLGKPLRHDLKNKRRVPLRHHSYVLVYSIDKETQTVTIENYDSHDGVYGNHYHRR